MTQINIVLDGKPIPKARPRFIPSCSRVYNSQHKIQKKERWRLQEEYGSNQPLKGIIDLTVIFVFERPKCRKDDIYHTDTPDLDNLLKFLCDIGNGILWADDRQVAQIHAKKIYGENAKTVITIREIENEL